MASKLPARATLRHIPSPNFGARRGGARVSLIVLHYTAVPCDRALELLCDPEREVSAHYLITETGELISLVPEAERAWHAGRGHWGGITDVNSHSIGIEIENDGKSVYSEPAMLLLEDLLGDLLHRYKLPPEAVIGHSDLAPDRKPDPGPLFDWQRLARSGLSIWPNAEPQDPDEATFLRHAATFGYGPDFGAEVILTAFRLRFRPGATGPLSAEDMGIMSELARRWPAFGH